LPSYWQEIDLPTKRGMTILFVPHDRKESLTVRLEGWQITVGIVVLIAAVLLLVLGVIMGGKSVKLLAENSALRSEIERLRIERVKIARLERELAETENLRRWMEELIGIDENREKPPVQMATTGGGELFSLLESTFEPRLLPELKDEVEDHIRRLEFIPRGLPVKGPITARFGEMGGKFMTPHTGVDIAAPEGSIVRVTAAGIISEIANDKQLGITVTVDHLNGYETLYGHLSAVSCKKGDWVEPGDKVGTVGETGHAKGPHVHYELTVDGRAIDPMGDTSNTEKGR